MGKKKLLFNVFDPKGILKPDYNPKDLRKRTPGERLWLARKAAGLTQVEAAAREGVGETAYAQAEKDRFAGATPFKSPFPPVSKPALPALLALARRREGLGLDGTAAALGVSKVTLLAWEREGRLCVRSYWACKGFIFP